MPKPRANADDLIAGLAGLSSETPRDEADAALRAALSSRAPQAIARAARVAATIGQVEVADALESACARLLDQPAKADPGCLAKAAIVEALAGFEAHCPAIYRRCLEHVQMEPVYGGRVDTAGALRGLSAQALVRCLGADAFAPVLPVLVDSEAAARRGALHSLTAWGDRCAELLLRLFALARPTDDAISDAFAALLEIAPERSADFVASYLRSAHPETAEAAALALGESRAAAAFDLLREHWDLHVLPKDRGPLLLPLALTRSEAALDLLADTVAYGAYELAVRAVEAARHSLHRPTWRDRFAEAVARRDDEDLTDRWRQVLADDSATR